MQTKMNIAQSNNLKKKIVELKKKNLKYRKRSTLKKILILIKHTTKTILSSLKTNRNVDVCLFPFTAVFWWSGCWSCIFVVKMDKIKQILWLLRWKDILKRVPNHLYYYLNYTPPSPLESKYVFYVLVWQTLIKRK